MKQIVIISGKGGTGKTSVSASLAYLAGSRAVVADCDVDAADMHLVTAPQVLERRDFFSGYEAVIDPEACAGCGDCVEVCHFDAIIPEGDVYRVLPLECEGCGYCPRVCPVEAIEMRLLKAGEIFVSRTRMDNVMVHAALKIGSDMSGKLVAEVRKEARLQAEKVGAAFIIIDGSPGTGCPVTASITGTDQVVLVTEPTLSGMHDMKRVLEVVENFGIPAGMIINKADINPEITEELKRFAEEKGITLLGTFPYDDIFVEAVNSGRSVAEMEGTEPAKRMQEVWKKLPVRTDVRPGGEA